MTKFQTLICKAAKDTDGTIIAVASTPDVDATAVIVPSVSLAALQISV